MPGVRGRALVAGWRWAVGVRRVPARHAPGALAVVARRHSASGRRRVGSPAARDGGLEERSERDAAMTDNPIDQERDGAALAGVLADLTGRVVQVHLRGGHAATGIVLGVTGRRLLRLSVQVTVQRRDPDGAAAAPMAMESEGAYLIADLIAVVALPIQAEAPRVVPVTQPLPASIASLRGNGGARR